MSPWAHNSRRKKRNEKKRPLNTCAWDSCQTCEPQTSEHRTVAERVVTQALLILSHRQYCFSPDRVTRSTRLRPILWNMASWLEKLARAEGRVVTRLASDWTPSLRPRSIGAVGPRACTRCRQSQVTLVTPLKSQVTPLSSQSRKGPCAEGIVVTGDSQSAPWRRSAAGGGGGAARGVRLVTCD